MLVKIKVNKDLIKTRQACPELGTAQPQLVGHFLMKSQPFMSNQASSNECTYTTPTHYVN